MSRADVHARPLHAATLRLEVLDESGGVLWAREAYDPAELHTEMVGHDGRIDRFRVVRPTRVITARVPSFPTASRIVMRRSGASAETRPALSIATRGEILGSIPFPQAPR
ncbi:MAG: hypothetical protein ACJ78W_16255 [Myxococcales bacterium]